MSLPKNLYDTFKALKNCKLAQSKDRNFTEADMTEFQDILNAAQPLNEDVVGNAQRELIRGMFYSNRATFYNYLRDRETRVGALVLWTDSKYIVKYFNLEGRVHLTWNPETRLYSVSHHVARVENVGSTETPVMASSQERYYKNKTDSRTESKYVTPREKKLGTAKYKQAKDQVKKEKRMLKKAEKAASRPPRDTTTTETPVVAQATQSTQPTSWADMQ